MTDLTNILHAMDRGEPQAAEQLLPLVYDELKKLAAAKLAHEKPGHTLQPTALVHEAYLRLVPHSGLSSNHAEPGYENRRYFFAAAAEAMRRILIEQARAKMRLKRGGAHQHRHEWTNELPDPATHPDELLALNDEIDALAKLDTTAAELVKLRFFGGYNMAEAAEALSISPATAYRNWEFARAWLTQRLSKA